MEAVVSFGLMRSATNSFITNSNAVWYVKYCSGEDDICYVSWMASPVGIKSTAFQISEYVSIIVSFLGMWSTPGVFMYTRVRENRQYDTENFYHSIFSTNF